MKFCEGYTELDGYEQSEFLAKIIHVMQHDQEYFKVGQSLIRSGEANGLFEKVLFGREALLAEKPLIAEPTISQIS